MDVRSDSSGDRRDADEPLRRGNAVDDTYLTIRERIISGEYRPGIALSQVRLAEELSVSRTPLREALRRLEAENLVVGQANRGVVVAPITIGDIEDSYAIRLLVEPALLTGVLPVVSEGDLTAMSGNLDAMRNGSVSPRDFQVAHWDFHRILLRRFPAGVCTMIEEHLTRIDRHQRLYFRRPAAVEDLIGLDVALHDAIRAGESHRARALLEFHLLDTALGLIAEAEPDHEFSTLRIAMQGVGIRAGELGAVRTGGPVTVDWVHAQARDALAEMSTTNLTRGSLDLTAAAAG